MKYWKQQGEVNYYTTWVKSIATTIKKKETCQIVNRALAKI